jgi:hypothetical protein
VLGSRLTITVVVACEYRQFRLVGEISTERKERLEFKKESIPKEDSKYGLGS